MEGLPVYFPSRPLATDNAAMIAAAAYPKFLAGDFAAGGFFGGSWDEALEVGTGCLKNQFPVLRLEFSEGGSFALGAASQHGLERLFELGLDVDIFEDGEVGPVLVGVESAVLTRHDDDGNVGRLGLSL